MPESDHTQLSGARLDQLARDCSCEPCEGCDVVCSQSCHGCALYDTAEGHDRYLTHAEGRAQRARASFADEYASRRGTVSSAPMSPVHRRFSFEQEVSNGFHDVRQMWSYVDAPFGLDAHSDATCDGELVFSRVEAWNANHAQAFRALLHAHDWQRRNGGGLRVSYSCGGHIHVGTRSDMSGQMGQRALVALYNAFCHLEDLLYRLAASGWDDHRSAMRDDDWCSKLDKLGGEHRRSPMRVWQTAGTERYLGMNLTNWMGAMSACQCHAVAVSGDWRECVCGIPERHQNTVEYRLWNSTLKPHRAEAFAVVSLALTEHAAQAEDRHTALSSLPVNEWHGTVTHPSDRNRLKRQTDYLFSRVLTTDYERAAVAAAVQDCDPLTVDVAASEGVV